MTIDIQEVSAGELITSSYINKLVHALADLDQRVTTLEDEGTGSPPPQGPIAIDSITPSAPEGGTVTITGHGFGSTLGDAIVTFATVPTPHIQLQTDTTIICTVPSIPALHVPNPPPQATVQVQVSNFVSSASRSMTVTAFNPPIAGSIALDFEDASPDPLTQNVNNDFQFLLTSNASQQTTVTLAPALGGGGAAWTATLLDDAKNPIPSGQIPLASGVSKTFYVRVAVPDQTNQTAFTLGVTGTAAGLAPASTSNLGFTVGQFADPDNTFTLSPTTTSPANALTGSTLTADFGTEVDVFMDAEFTVADSYEVTLATVPANLQHWTIDIGNPVQNQQGKHIHTVTQQDIDNSAGGRVPKTIEIAVLPDNSAVDAQLRVVVKGSAATKSHTFTFDLHPTAP